MSISAPHPLDASVAGLLADLRAESARLAAEASLVAVLQALILTALARIIARLGDLIALWRAGLLPMLHPARPHPARPRLPRTHSRVRTPATSPRRRPHQAPAAMAALRPAAPEICLIPMRQGAGHPPEPFPLPIRLVAQHTQPPAPSRFWPCLAVELNHAQFIAIS